MPHQTLNYTDFFDIQQAPPEKRQAVEEEFLRRLEEFLARLSAAQAAEIARQVWEKMMVPERHYHTPVHILGMLGATDGSAITLSDDEQLAVWFHDVVYDAREAFDVNEQASAAWMLGALGGSGVESAILESAAEGIRCTARHLDEDVPARHHTLMDLDLAGLAWSGEVFDRAGRAIRLEYSYLSDDLYNKNRVAFFRRLLARPRLYRSKGFADAEKKAREQVQREIVRLGG